MNTDNLWNEFLDKIKERITPLSYDTWFKDTKLYKLDGGTATIIVPLALHKKHLEENYIDDIEETFNSITGTNFNFKFILENEINEISDNNEEVIIGEYTDISICSASLSDSNAQAITTGFDGTVSTSIREITDEGLNSSEIYGISGYRKYTLTEGVNIIRTNGKTRKIYKK